MGQEEGGDVLVHEARVSESSKLVIMSATRRSSASSSRKRPATWRPGGGVAHELVAVPGEIRQQADGDGVFDVDERAEGPGQDHLFQVLELEADAFQQGDVAREHGPLGPHQVVDVGFADVRSWPLWFRWRRPDVFPPLSPIRCGGVQVLPELAVGGDDIRVHHGRQEVDEAGAGDALWVFTMSMVMRVGS